MLNEAGSLPKFLASLECQTVQPHELVVTDGGSSDSTIGVLGAWKARSNITTRIIVSPGAGIAEGRNIAISATSCELVAITDAGTVLDSDWLAEISEPVLKDADVSAGFFRPSGTSVMEKIIASIITPAIEEIDPDTFLPSSRSLALRKSAWATVGGYPEWLDYCEDLVFDIGLKRSGAIFQFAPKAQVTWAARPNLKAFAKQYFRYARGDGKAALWPKRHAVRYASYLAGTALLCSGFRNFRYWALLGCLSLIYLSRFWLRVYRARSMLGSNLFGAVMMTPLIVVIGDVAKMIGYPLGVMNRVRHRRARNEQA